MTDESKQVDDQDLVEKQENVTSETEEKAPIPRHHVTDIVRRERRDAYEKGRREAMAEMQAQQTAPVESQMAPQAPAAQASMGGMPQMSPEQIQQLIAKAVQESEAKRQQEDLDKRQSEAAYGVAQKFNASMANGKTKYPDFDEKVKDLDFQTMSPLVYLATDTGMADDIMYDLAENPHKIANLMILAHSQPAMAKREMDKLAASIRNNQDAKKQVQPKEPLSQITPSNVGTDSGEMSVSDFRRMFAGQPG